MKFLNHMRSRSRLRNGTNERQVYHHHASSSASYSHSHTRPFPILPQRVLRTILKHVCPHTQDESYLTSEESMVDGGCMLCDMRDLAQCALVRREWAEAVALLL